MSSADIIVEDVWKTFRIFQNKNTTLKQALTRRRGTEYEEFWALRGVSFEVPTGSTFGLIGANGAGKSTMLKVLARILVPDKGRVALRGRMSALLELGAGFHPELTGRENIFLNGSILGMSQRTVEGKLDEIIEFSGLEAFIDQPVKTYSSGMYARLGFSVAVSVEPDVLLVDEVLAVGDEQFQRRCSERMSELRSGGRTVVLVSHSLPQIQRLCDSAVWIDHGQVKAIGETEDVVNQYLGSVNTGYRLDENGHQRSGTGEINVQAEILTPDGPWEPGIKLETETPVTIRLFWKSEEVLTKPICSFALRSADGYMVAGSGIKLGGGADKLDPGSGFVDYVIPALPLLPGSYHLSTAVSDRASGQIYDHCPNILEFDVAMSRGHEQESGATSLNGEWVEGSRER